jgi:phosphoglycerate dehydrogenase-like enzyme
MTGHGPVVVTYPGFDLEDERTAGALRGAGFTIRYEPRRGERSPADVARFMADASAGIVSTDPFDASVFAACPKLRVLARVGVGTDAIDLRAATRSGVAVTITPGANVNTVADHTLAMILACSRRLLQNDRAVRDGLWERGGPSSGTDLTGATVGIVGLGEIGRAVAQRLRGFDVKVLGTDVLEVSWDGVPRVGLDELLVAANVVTLHVPLIPSTRGMIGARELALMRPDAILINTSRGGVVDEDALVVALEQKRLLGAGLDVFAREPPVGSSLLGMANVVLSPHTAGISIYSQQTMLEMATTSILEVMAGGEPPGLLNPDALVAARAASVEPA